MVFFVFLCRFSWTTSAYSDVTYIPSILTLFQNITEYNTSVFFQYMTALYLIIMIDLHDWFLTQNIRALCRYRRQKANYLSINSDCKYFQAAWFYSHICVLWASVGSFILSLSQSTLWGYIFIFKWNTAWIFLLWSAGFLDDKSTQVFAIMKWNS